MHFWFLHALNSLVQIVLANSNKISPGQINWWMSWLSKFYVIGKRKIIISVRLFKQLQRICRLEMIKSIFFSVGIRFLLSLDKILKTFDHTRCCRTDSCEIECWQACIFVCIVADWVRLAEKELIHCPQIRWTFARKQIVRDGIYLQMPLTHDFSSESAHFCLF